MSSPRIAGASPARRSSRRLACLGLLLVTVVAGLLWRLGPFALPPFAFKYGGSVLWAMAVYWVIALLLPYGGSVRIAVLAGAVALVVELFKLVYWPPLDRFRETLAGKLLLGRYFSFGAIVAYWLGILFIAALDDRVRKHWKSNVGLRGHTSNEVPL